jgi:hypothetical protein
MNTRSLKTLHCRRRACPQSAVNFVTAAFRDQHGGAVLPGSPALGVFVPERAELADQVAEDDCGALSFAEQVSRSVPHWHRSPPPPRRRHERERA